MQYRIEYKTDDNLIGGGIFTTKNYRMAVERENTISKEFMDKKLSGFYSVCYGLDVEYIYMYLDGECIKYIEY